MSAELTQLFEGASNVTQQNVLLLLQRDHVGQKKYGCSLDRTDLTADEWFNHAIEEVGDLLGYIQAAKNKLGSDPNPSASNAREVSIPKKIHDLFMGIALTDDEKNTALRALVASLYVREPNFWKLVRVLLELQEAKEYQKSPQTMPADVMLHMVNGFTQAQKRGLLKEGLEHATGERVIFKDVTPPKETQ